MIHAMIADERRGALRVPVRGVGVLYASDGPLHGMLENLSLTGALVSVASRPADTELDIELRLDGGSGWVAARIVRAEPVGRQWRLAVTFDRVDGALKGAIEAAIAVARGAAQRRPILVIDENADRKRALIAQLAELGMTALAPRTPLEAIDLLTRAQLHVGVCLLAPGFGVPSTDLRAALVDSFPWLSVTDITDDLDATTHHALDVWHATPLGRVAEAQPI
jgi:CheY-like chemotaxis protein